MTPIITTLLAKHPLISDQVNKAQVEVILRELTRVIDSGLAGDIVEFGCYVGTTSLFIRRLLDALGESAQRSFDVYDSFAGLPAKSAQDASVTGEQFVPGELAASKKQFMLEFHKARLRPPIVHKGWFADLTEEDVPNKIAFAFLDGDFYDSIRDSLQLVVPRTQAGGTIVIDDYAREALPGAARAAHEFFSPESVQTTHNLGIIHLP